MVDGGFGVDVVAADDVTIGAGVVDVTVAGLGTEVSTRPGVVELCVGVGVSVGLNTAATALTPQQRTRSRPTTPPIMISALNGGVLSRPGRVGSCTTEASRNVTHSSPDDRVYTRADRLPTCDRTAHDVLPWSVTLNCVNWDEPPLAMQRKVRRRRSS